MRTLAIFKRILLQRRGDRRSLALLFVAPLVILGLMYLLLQVPSKISYRIGIDNQTTSVTKNLPNDAQLSYQLNKNDKLTIVKVSNNSRSTINDKNLAAVIIIKDDGVDVTYANTDTGKTQVIGSVVNALVQVTQGKKAQLQIQQAIDKAIQQMVAANPQLASKAGSLDLSSLSSTSSSSFKISNHYLYGSSSLSPFDNLAPVLVAFFVFFFVFLISGISLVNERSSGTLIRMLVTPVKRSEIVAGYTLAYGLLAVVQTTLVVLWARYGLGMKVLGNFAWVLVINLLIALIALLMGLALSAFSKTEFQFVQFIPIAIVPQFLFSGIINVDTMAQPLQWLAHIMPLYYGVDALQKVVKQGMGFSQIGLDLVVLVGITVLLYFLNVMALKNLRRT